MVMLSHRLLLGVVLSGSVAALEYILGVPRIRNWAIEQRYANLIGLLAESGSVAAFEYALSIERIYTPQDLEKAVLGAGKSGSVAMLKHLLETKRLDPFVQDDHRGGVFNSAIGSGSIEAVLYLHSFNPDLYRVQVAQNHGNHPNPEMGRILELIDTNLYPRREKISKTARNLAAGAVVSGMVLGGYALITHTVVTGTFLLGVCCTGAVGVLLIALMASCVRNRRIGFFEPSPDRFGSYRSSFPSAPRVEEVPSPRPS
jgi:hypothetical protein